METKMCPKCKIEKPFGEFYNRTTSADGKRCRCKVCESEEARLYREANSEKIKEYGRRYREANPEKIKEANLVSRYGITLADYDALLQAQDGGCATCGEAPPDSGYLCIDHNHDTGQVRGLLCPRCNTALGFAGDSPAILRKMADYLEEQDYRYTQEQDK